MKRGAMADRVDTAAQASGLERKFIDLGDSSFAEVIGNRTLRDDSIREVNNLGKCKEEL